MGNYPSNRLTASQLGKSVILTTPLTNYKWIPLLMLYSLLLQKCDLFTKISRITNVNFLLVGGIESITFSSLLLLPPNQPNNSTIMKRVLGNKRVNIRVRRRRSMIFVQKHLGDRYVKYVCHRETSEQVF